MMILQEMITFLERVAREDRELALRASDDSSGLERTTRPVSWTWSGMTGTAAVPDERTRFLVDAIAEHDCRTTVCLQSLERRDPYGLAVEAIAVAQEVTAAAGAHIVRNDPAAAVRRVDALEAVLVEARRVLKSAKAFPVASNYNSVMIMKAVLRALASEHDRRAGYDPAWALDR